MVEPKGYLAELERSGHEPPIPAGLMFRVFDGYERRKQTSGKIDFEDMLGLAVQMFDRRTAAAIGHVTLMLQPIKQRATALRVHFEFGRGLGDVRRHAPVFFAGQLSGES
jgi:hypothetical protein